jgi:hypothetical protein
MLGGGVTANHVLYNFTAGSGTITSQVGNLFYGTLLAPKLSFNLDGAFIGEIIGGGSSIQLLSNATVNAGVNTGVNGVLPNTATVTSTDNIPGTLTASATITVTGTVASGTFGGSGGSVPVGADMFATIGFWHNQNGQSLIDQLNGGGTSGSATALGNWLATNFPHLYGAQADPSNPYEANLAGSTNAQVASFYQKLFGAGGLNKTYAQIMAAALASYATDSSLAGGTWAQSFGFLVKAGGYGTSFRNVGSSGTSLGLGKNTSYSVLSLLKATDQLAAQGTSQLTGNLSGINTIFNGINTTGDIINSVTPTQLSGTVAFSPAQIRTAYGISGLSEDGTGQTIAIVDAYSDPSILQAVDTFDAQFGLTSTRPTLFQQYGPANSFLTVLNQSGQSTPLPATDPSGPGAANWEMEEALDVEWIHAMAPGAQIVLVEADSQALSDLMTAVGTAAAQPGVSVVSMSWGFTEGQAVFGANEASYDGVFNVPGVTFLASTGDYGVADPEYPAFSPNVVAVGGTSLALNADSSYNSEAGWGYYSDSAGTMIGTGGGISAYETEPSFQQGVQSTGYRTTPDVSTVADPATGAWIADPYNLDPTNPFAAVGGTSLSAPIWAGLVAMVNQGRAGAGEASLNSSSPSETLQALYTLPQSDYNSITSGDNGYTANAGYNLVTGLGTPIAGSLVPNLVAYHGPGTTYSGPTVGPLQDAALSGTWTGDGGTTNVFNVFNTMPVGHGAFRTRSQERATKDTAGRMSISQEGQVSSADADSTLGAQAQPSSPNLVYSAVTGSGAMGPIGLVPTSDANAAHDAVLAGWSSSQKPAANQPVNVIIPGLTSTPRTTVIQGDAVDSALEAFGALPSLLGGGDQGGPGTHGKLRRPLA